MEKKLNIGCGTDYREGFINIDGSATLPKVDLRFNLGKESLNSHFTPGSIDYILANDIIEHHFHWEAVAILTEFYELLKVGGKVEIRVPDCEIIISSKNDIETKLIYLFGGQDVPQGINIEMNKSRAQFPEFFCHKYGWTTKRMKLDLIKIGFKVLKFQTSGTNFIVWAQK